MSLFTEDVDNRIIDDVELDKRVKEHIQGYQQLERLNDILADFFIKNGPICTTGKIKDTYKSLEKLGKIVVVRTPSVTDKTGKPSRFFADEKGKTTKLRWQS